MHSDGSGAGPNSQTTNHPKRHHPISGASQLARQGTMLILRTAMGMVAPESVQHGKTGSVFLSSIISL